MAFNFDAFFDWSENLEIRNQSLSRFARSAGAAIQHDCATWGAGLYLILHFDLLTVNDEGEQLDRARVYEIVAEVVGKNRGTRLGGSVYIVPLLPLKRSEACAAMFWNAIGESLDGHLVAGDSFYLHYAPDFRNLMGGIAQVVPVGSTSLNPAAEPVL